MKDVLRIIGLNFFLEYLVIKFFVKFEGEDFFEKNGVEVICDNVIV